MVRPHNHHAAPLAIDAALAFTEAVTLMAGEGDFFVAAGFVSGLGALANGAIAAWIISRSTVRSMSSRRLTYRQPLPIFALPSFLDSDWLIVLQLKP